MTTADWLMIAAVLVAPFSAVFAQRAIEVWWEMRQRRLRLFKELMASRGSTLSYQHVQALNMLELEFSGSKFKDIREAWREYHDHLNSCPQRDVEDFASKLSVWTSGSDQFLGNLLQTMAKHLKYDFEPVLIKKGAYTPKGHTDIELENQAMRHLLLEVLSGDRNLRVSSIPDDEDAAKYSQRLQKALLAVVEGKRSLVVRSEESEAKNK